MVVKKIKNKPGNPKPKEWQNGDLVDYIRNPKDINPEEKIEYSGSRSFTALTHIGQKSEMISLAHESSRSRMPVQHWIYSWQEGEQPTAEHVEKLVNIFLKEMGLEGHQVIYGLHNNTENYHLHIAVNRIRPETHKAVLPYNGFDIEAAHRILAKVEDEQGWKKEENSLYTVLENGDVARTRKKTSGKLLQKARDFECATGAKSAQRIAQERATSFLKSATSCLKTILKDGALLSMSCEKKFH